MARKTIEVAKLKERINGYLARKEISQDEKKSLCILLESVLMDTGNYRGFNQTYWLDKGFDEWKAAGRPNFPEKDKFLGPEYDRVYF